jgi:hypothetical protein
MTGDLKTNYPFRNSTMSNPSGEKIWHYLTRMNSKFQRHNASLIIPLRKMMMCWTLYSIRMLECQMSLFLISWTQTIYQKNITYWNVSKLRIFRNLLKNSDWVRFQSLTSDLISSRIKINSEVEANEEELDFTASIASAYKLSTSKVTLPDINNDHPGSDNLL